MPLTYHSMNAGDTYVLDVARAMYVWMGEMSNDMERAKARFVYVTLTIIAHCAFA